MERLVIMFFYRILWEGLVQVTHFHYKHNAMYTVILSIPPSHFIFGKL